MFISKDDLDKYILRFLAERGTVESDKAIFGIMAHTLIDFSEYVESQEKLKQDHSTWKMPEAVTVPYIMRKE